MGVDAVVFKSLETLPAMEASDVAAVRVDEMTGEAYFASEHGVRLRREDVIATERRLGNASLISALRKEVGRSLGDNYSSLLLSKVLYDGTHSGDTIRPEDLDVLKQELFVLKNHETQQSRELHEFMSNMEELIRAAHQHGNPIVFV